ncbi:histone-like nucleoid-structuring protein Lsr2 [Streptomyces sp. NPDC058614]|uniref:Lsr2 family DNA-binding protein n=1 Tax=Streptomyces sp. NPDC058614 TaxID=3346557 RepID=UPI0036634EF3
MTGGTWGDLYPWIAEISERDRDELQGLADPCLKFDESPRETAQWRPYLDDLFDALGLLTVADEVLRHRQIATLVPSLQGGDVLPTFLSGQEWLTEAILSAVGGSRGLTEMSPAQIESSLGLSCSVVTELMTTLLRVSALGVSGATRIDLATPLTDWFNQLDSSDKYFLRTIHSEGDLRWLGEPSVRERALRTRMVDTPDKILDEFDFAAEGSLRYVVSAFEESIKFPVRKETLLARHSWLGSDLPGEEFDALALLHGMRKWWRSQDGWFSMRTLPWLQSETLRILDLEQGEVMTLETADRLLRAQRVQLHAEDLEAWLEYCNTMDKSSGLVSRLDPVGQSQALQPTSLTSPEVRGAAAGSLSAAAVSGGSIPSAMPLQASGNMNSIMRSWARSQGYEIGDRGRIPASILEAFEVALRTPEGVLVQENNRLEMPASRIQETGHGKSVVDVMMALSKLARVSFPEETLGSLLLRSSEFEGQIGDLIEQLLAATADPQSEAGWVIHEGVPKEPDSVHASGYATLKERALKALQSAQCPLSLQRLAENMEGDVKKNSLRVQIAADDRFVRCDVDAWALADWGMRPYRSIKDLVSEEVDLAGGEIATAELVDKLTTQFSIKEITLRQVVSSPPFTSRNGTVRRIVDLDDQRPTGERGEGERHSNPSAVDLVRDLGLDF